MFWNRKTLSTSLTGFFPCPRPAYATLTNEDLIPIPDYKQYIDLADELDTISERISKLTKILRLSGGYDASAEGVGKMLEPGADGKMVAISNLSALIGKSAAAGGGLNGVVVWLPIDMIAQALVGLYQARDQAKNTLYEMSRHIRYRARTGRPTRKGVPVQDQGPIRYTAPGSTASGRLSEPHGTPHGFRWS